MPCVGGLPLPRPLTLDEEVSLAQRIEQGDQVARNRLVEANLGLVSLIANQYRGRGVSLSDLVQEGSIGLLEAAVRYDHRRQVKFSTYAVWRVRSRMLDALAGSSLIRLPARITQRRTAVRQAEALVSGTSQRAASIEEIVKVTSLSPSAILAARQYTHVAAPLDKAVSEGGLTVSERLADDRVEDPIERLIADEDASDLVRWLALLPARHRDVLQRRYGLAGHRPQSYHQIGRDLGLGEDRCRQLEREALQRVRAVAQGPMPDIHGG